MLVTKQLVILYCCSITAGESGERSKLRNRIHKVHRHIYILIYMIAYPMLYSCFSPPVMTQGSTSTAVTPQRIQPYPPPGVISMSLQMPGLTHEPSSKLVTIPTPIGQSMVGFADENRTFACDIMRTSYGVQPGPLWAWIYNVVHWLASIWS